MNDSMGQFFVQLPVKNFKDVCVMPFFDVSWREPLPAMNHG